MRLNKECDVMACEMGHAAGDVEERDGASVVVRE